MNNRARIKELRPSIPTITDTNQTSEFERFQNRTLRPILKFQNDLLTEIFKDYLQKRKAVFYKLSKEQQKEYVSKAVRQDLKFRNLVIGLVIGHFTAEEYLSFRSQEKELTRRIGDLSIQRIQSQFCED